MIKGILHKTEKSQLFILKIKMVDVDYKYAEVPQSSLFFCTSVQEIDAMLRFSAPPSSPPPTSAPFGNIARLCLSIPVALEVPTGCHLLRSGPAEELQTV